MRKYLVLFIFMAFMIVAGGCSDINVAEKETAKAEWTYKDTVRGVPVLMYHSIGFDKTNAIIMKPEQFEAQMKYLKDNGYSAISLDMLYAFLQNGEPLPDKPVVITLDDGYADNYTYAFPILKKYDMGATIFVITSMVDKNSEYLNSAQLKELDAAGIKIESHCVLHLELNKMSSQQQYHQLKDSKEFLEKLLNKSVNFIAYPSGKYNDDTVKAAKDAGYKMAFTTKAGWSGKNDGIYTLKRVYVSAFYSMDTFAERIQKSDYKQY